MKKILLSLFLSAAFFVNAQNVGIGTTTPLARLHVIDSSVVFSATGFNPSIPGNPPISIGGRRMMWYADKAAFRAGYVSNTYWEKDSTGEYSVAFGYNNRASGFASTATGFFTNASGYASTAMGFTTASGSYSTAMGYGNKALGEVSIAMGYNTNASGGSSTAMGSSTNASGYVSTAMGNFNMASGYYSTAMGNNTRASGTASTAIGSNTRASGTVSTAMGDGATASGYSSTAIGNGGQANSDFSNAIGESVTANSWNSTSLGRYNDPIVESPTTGWILTEPLLIVGNGTSAVDKKNALVILKNGNVGLGGSNNPDAPLTLASGFGKRINIFTGGSGHIGMSVQPGILQIYGDFPGAVIGLGYQQNSLITVTNPTGFQYNLNIYGDGNAELRGVLTQHSDARFKSNILPITSSLSSLLKLNGYTYNWKDKTQDSTRQIGLIAQEVQQLFPELVKENKTGELSVNYSGLIPLLITGMKEQQKQIDELKKENENILKQFYELKKREKKL
jgi:endosialidase-like protein/trimeric autotransporter adhesin